MDSFSAKGSSPIGPRSTPTNDRPGQAALLLVESLMHALLERGVISREDFIEVIEGAAEVDHELRVAKASPPADSNGSLLHPLAAAFRRELGK